MQELRTNISIVFSRTINTYLCHGNNPSCFRNETLSILEADHKIPVTGIVKVKQTSCQYPGNAYMRRPSPTLNAVTFIYFILKCIQQNIHI